MHSPDQPLTAPNSLSSHSGSSGLAWSIGAWTLLLFACSSVRHVLFQSGVFDLGIFDQAVYLISRGMDPLSSFLDFHILGDHAAWVLYPLAALYWLYPSVYWLLAIQALALGGTAWAIVLLARQAGLTQSQTVTVVWAYLLYPLIFNVNLFDFHPDVLAVPALLVAVWGARARRPLVFGLGVVLVLGCKAALGLTVAAMGVWLFLEKRRGYGAIALAAGIAWFLVAAWGIIPALGGDGATVSRHLSRYGSLGNTIPEVLSSLVLRPDLVLGKVFSLASLEYLALLLVPVLWGLSFRHLTPLVAALPTLALNLLADSATQRNLVFQYSLPVLPFLMVAVIDSIADRPWIRNPRIIFLWSLVGFLALAKYGYFGSLYLEELDTWRATRSALSQVPVTARVLTTHEIAPHLTHRSQIEFTDVAKEPDLEQFDSVLLNTRHPGWRSTQELSHTLVEIVRSHPRFRQQFSQEGVYLFQRVP